MRSIWICKSRSLSRGMCFDYGATSRSCSSPRAQLEVLLHRLDEQAGFATADSYAHLLQLCGKLKALPEGKRVHEHIVRHGLERDTFLGNHIVNMYGKCGSLQDAMAVFEEMGNRNVFSWTAIISAFTQLGQGKQAIELFRRMQEDGVMPDRITFVSVINACANSGALAEGRLIHACLIEEGFEENVVVGTALLDMYRKCGSLEDACEMFDRMEHRNVLSWTAMIAAFAQNQRIGEALQLFQSMQQNGLIPDRITYVTLLEGCSPNFLAEGRAIHAHIVRSGFEQDVVVGTALVNMYGKCRRLEDARRVFDRMQHRNVVSWTTIIAEYALRGCREEAIKLFLQMFGEGVKPDKVTVVSVLNACASPADYKAIHHRLVETGLESDEAVVTALISMYCRWGCLEEAREMLDRMRSRDVVSWNAMFAAYGTDEAVELFQRMLCEGVKPNSNTFATVLDTCSSLVALRYGKVVHACVRESGFQSDVVVVTALVDMYGKCGSLKDAGSLFDGIRDKDVVLWTALVAAYAQQGHGEEALKLFRQMQQERVKPNEVTFLSILSACRHAGLVDEAQQYFATMVEDHGITPSVEHHGCMIDLYGRAGRLSEAEDVINGMPSADLVAWRTLLAACRSHGDWERGKRAAERVLELDPHGAVEHERSCCINTRAELAAERAYDGAA